ncbi:hypothetical protein [Candidatus Accumulibacter sp. ACC005]|uniref:hypothetical protein n=1 Tax=Candidatus Accumulibacter sp. ACC005 TaxID=2823331 RepID=UPI0025C49430|nr:hypothetical protein [Candidatus Accumulibacter sp. ACC005]
MPIITDMKPPNSARTPHRRGHSGRSASVGQLLAASHSEQAARVLSIATRQYLLRGVETGTLAAALQVQRQRRENWPLRGP